MSNPEKFLASFGSLFDLTKKAGPGKQKERLKMQHAYNASEDTVSNAWCNVVIEVGDAYCRLQGDVERKRKVDSLRKKLNEIEVKVDLDEMDTLSVSNLERIVLGVPREANKVSYNRNSNSTSARVKNLKKIKKVGG